MMKQMKIFDWFLAIFTVAYVVLYFSIPFYGFEDLYPNIALGLLLVGIPTVSTFRFIKKFKK